MDSFEFWLRRTEGKLERIALRPNTREEANEFLEMTKVSNTSTMIMLGEMTQKNLPCFICMKTQSCKINDSTLHAT